MNSKLKRFKSRAMFTIVGGVIIINPAFAQTPAQDDATTLDTVVVTGMRSSLDQSMNLKRDTPGIVDAISAVATGPGDRPIEPVVISSIDIASV